MSGKEAKFVAGGGWIQTGSHLEQPKTRLAWLATLSWFSGGCLMLSAWPEVFTSVLAASAVGQGALIGVAILFHIIEKPVETKTLIQNPNVKPHCLY